MNDVLGKVVAILICAYLMFLYPLSVMKIENQRMEKTYLYQETICFVDGIRNTGKIMPSAMKAYKDKVSKMVNIYKIELTHEIDIVNGEESYQEIFTLKQIQEVLEQDETYVLNKNDFIKIVIKDNKNQSVLYYGGSIKAVNEENLSN